MLGGWPGHALENKRTVTAMNGWLCVMVVSHSGQLMEGICISVALTIFHSRYNAISVGARLRSTDGYCATTSYRRSSKMLHAFYRDLRKNVAAMSSGESLNFDPFLQFLH